MTQITHFPLVRLRAGRRRMDDALEAARIPLGLRSAP